MEVAFEKWHGCKNDFMVIWNDRRQNLVVESLKRQAPALCSRLGGGVGADGILVLITPTGKELFPDELLIINADGSTAANCGNGLRCATASVVARARQETGKIELPEGVDLTVNGRRFGCRIMTPLNIRSSERSLPMIAVDMGEPKFNEACDWFGQAKDEVQQTLERLKIKIRLDEIEVAEIGNRHIVIFTDTEYLPLITTLGPALQQSSHWDGINVHLAAAISVDKKERPGLKQLLGNEIAEDGYDVRVWERGVGETQACGSGACAVAGAAIKSGQSSAEAWCQIKMPGGNLYVQHRDPESDIVLAGPAEFVFSGTLIV